VNVSAVRVKWAPENVRRSGLLAWLEVVLDDVLELDGLALRRTTSGDLSVTYPTRRDGAGREHTLVRPLGEAMRRAIERQVVEMIDLEAGGAL
jgi:DNA-binding cell septation regulator SpoVG